VTYVGSRTTEIQELTVLALYASKLRELREILEHLAKRRAA
jgi:hypothetical protein